MVLICSSFFPSLPAPNKLDKSKYGFHGLRSETMPQAVRSEAVSCEGWTFVGGSKLNFRPRFKRMFVPRKGKAGPAVCVSLWTNSQIARSVFTMGTAAVLPFYTLMVLAPRAAMTKKSMSSCLPYIVFGIVYSYLLYLSWTPGTLRAMFANKYWMPELNAIASLFTNEMSLSSAWIHLLAIDLFAARQVYHEGLANDPDTQFPFAYCSVPSGFYLISLPRSLPKAPDSEKG